MRLVSLCPSLTEALFDLGVGASVVGATKFCVEPAAGLEGVPRVGGTKDPRIDRIVELAPDLVLMNEEENRREDHDALVERGYAVHASFPRTPDDVPGMLRGLGAKVGGRARAEDLASDVERALEFVRGGAPAEPVPFAALVWRDPWMAAGPDTFLSSVLETAGGTNVLRADEGRYPAVGLECLAERSPERVFLPSEPFPFRNRHRDELVSRTRLDPSRFVLCSGRSLTWHGHRTARALHDAARWIAGGEASSNTTP